ncbi:MAG TPA: TM0106 family RecB-like putative nuclease, partial [Terriglobales bacterium]|nr:TM0106 family RecB-like putative nuclease [Terriglobales bacterium]
MRLEGSAVRLSASDLSGQLGCRHLTLLDLEVARGNLTAPLWRDPALVVLQQRGLEHEQAYVQHLQAAGCSVVDVASKAAFGAGIERTRAAMISGVDVIVQATVGNDRWGGRADVLRRVEVPSSLGSWSYEVVDTKLTAETRGGTILQLCLYSELLQELQDRQPEWMHVVAPGNGFVAQPFRVSNYLAYYRLVKGRLLSVVESDEPAALGGAYPEPVAQCDFCRWWSRCDARRRADDHLSLVAGISKMQMRELQSRSVTTLETVATISLPLEPRPRRGAMATYQRIREQARIQFEGRTVGQTLHELLPREADCGLARLPEPSAGDIFLDFEGDPFIGEHGLEYLFGFVVLDAHGHWSYQRRWALDAEQERAAFEELINVVMERWGRFPDLHIFHFAPYEPSAIKRMMGRYASRGEEVDRMLRGKLFVDLHAIVKQSIRASVERYSLKDLEPLFEFGRETNLRSAAEHLRLVQRRLELRDPERVSEESREVIEGYNREDCLSALRLRDWLEKLRASLIDVGEAVARPASANSQPSPELSEQQQQLERLREQLCADVPADVALRTDEQQARWLLAYMLDWHRCEDKSSWWEYFRLCELSDDDLLHERCALAALKFVEQIAPGKQGNPTERYSFVAQDNDFRGGEKLHRRD